MYNPAPLCEICNCHLQKNTAAIEKWNMLYDSFILNFNICVWFSLEIIDSHAFCNAIVRLFLSSMGAAILNHFPLSRESDWKRFHESTPRVTKIMRSRETFSLNLQWRCACDLNRRGVKGHLGVNDLWFKFFLRGHYIHILWWSFMRLGYNDPWVE